MRLTLTVNDTERSTDNVWPGENLLFVLRERLGLPGSKNACEQGECGSCTVYLDDLPVCACLVAAGQAEGRTVRTIEGLAASDPAPDEPIGGIRAPDTPTQDGDPELHPVQRAFLEAGAVQCGFCTPGLLIAVHDLLRRNPDPDDPEIREALAGNLCRCTGYEKVLDAVRIAVREMSA